MTSPDSVLGSQLHWAWLTIAYISPQTTHSLFIHGIVPHKSRNPYTFYLLGVCEQLNFSSEANIRWCLTYVNLIAHHCDAQIFLKNCLVPRIRQKPLKNDKCELEKNVHNWPFEHENTWILDKTQENDPPGPWITLMAHFGLCKHTWSAISSQIIAKMARKWRFVRPRKWSYWSFWERRVHVFFCIGAKTTINSVLD